MTNSKTTKESCLYDIVIFGANGFVGQYAIRDLYETIAEDNGKQYGKLRWAIAGRKMDKLQQTLADLDEELGTNLLTTVPIITADVDDLKSIEAMAQCTTVLLNCVGPYDDYGRPVVEACIRHGTAHLDLSAELQFIEGVQLQCDEAAKKNGALVISACGFCSVIPEMGIALARRYFTGTLHSVETYVDMKAGKKGFKINFGSFHSIMYSIVRIKQMVPIRRQLSKLFQAVQLPRSMVKQPQRLVTIPGPWSDAVGPSVVFPIPDIWVVKRTVHYNYVNHGERPIYYCAYFRVRPRSLTAWPIGCLFCCRPGRALLKRHIGCITAGFISKKGPTRDQVLGNTFSLRVVAKGWSEVASFAAEEPQGKRNLKVTMKLSGADPAYVVTAMALVQSGLTVLYDRELMPSGGVLTAGSAFRNTRLWERLQSRGIKVEVLKEDKM